MVPRAPTGGQGWLSTNAELLPHFIFIIISIIKITTKLGHYDFSTFYFLFLDEVKGAEPSFFITHLIIISNPNALLK